MRQSQRAPVDRPSTVHPLCHFSRLSSKEAGQSTFERRGKQLPPVKPITRHRSTSALQHPHPFTTPSLASVIRSFLTLASWLATINLHAKLIGLRLLNTFCQRSNSRVCRYRGEPRCASRLVAKFPLCLPSPSWCLEGRTGRADSEV
jgi:hypothetical protein